MISGNYFVIISIASVILFPSLLPAQVDVRGIKQRNEATRVIEEKCLICHNRQMIDEAIKDREQMEQVLRRMEKKGVVLTGKERRVIGHFWGQQVFRPDKSNVLPSH
jgi:hypothetical protein